MAKYPYITIEDATIMFPNFAGKEGTYNKEGRRNFCVVIDDSDRAQELADDGWNVKILPPRDEDEKPVYYIQVTVRFDNFPPKVIMISRGNKTKLDEESVASLDYADIEIADLIISGSPWEVNGKTGIKAYLKTGYFTIAEDVFASKYEE